MELKSVKDIIRNLDAYPKTLEDFRIKTYSGAFVTLVSIVVIVVLFAWELNYYLTPEVKEELFVDMSRGEKLRINLDIVFPRLSCSGLSLDAMDVSGEQHINIEHNLYKRRLGLDGKPLDQPVREESKSSVVVDTSPSSTTVMTTLDPKRCESCYGGGRNCCNTCQEVQEAYKIKGWAFPDPSSIAQCVREGAPQYKENEGCQFFGYFEVNRETKLNEKYNLKYKNYNILRKDRNKEGGGLAFLIKNLYYEDIAINIPNTSDLEAQEISTKTKTSSIKEKFWNFKKANWNLYQQNTNEDFRKAPTRIKDLEQNWISFKNTIIKAAKVSIPRDYALENTDLNKTPGPDGIHGQMISNLGKNGKEKLLDIFNNSWKTGKLPQDWKTATIIPIKKLDKSADDPKNYRPISLTSICCKLMEKIILRRLTYHLDTRNLLPKEQYGFRKGHGTIDQLLFFTQKFNITHQIKSLSFGRKIPGKPNPLEDTQQEDEADQERVFLDSAQLQDQEVFVDAGLGRCHDGQGVILQVMPEDPVLQIRGPLDDGEGLHDYWPDPPTGPVAVDQ
ncbi:ERGIC3 [Cordylochernes scorpioides]|uniref:Endoplasmic reticulum-Golgi intermediate compartment protein 3 n=1 Tax=Cordylochernes scorpioides TaxID=51811 RepID=A0ABY6L3A8_9ARAC|nr:ERGIC3 [Cordylochernes scorpioides]